MNILITGGSGFIGTRLIEDLLKKEHTIRIFDKANSDKYPELVTIGDVRDVNALREASRGMDVIYNLAAEHADDVTPLSLYADVNVGGAENVVAAAKANDIKHIVFTSSVAIYGLNRGEPDESFEAQPFNEYGRTKYEAEKIFLEWAKDDTMNSLTIVRPSVIFGENNRGNVYNLIKQIASGKFLMVGSGENKKSMGYVGNISAFLSYQVDNKNSGVYIYNFAGKPDLSSKEIVHIVKEALNLPGNTLSIPYWLGLLGGYTFDIIAKLTGKKFPVSSIRIKKFTAETTVNTDKLLESSFKEPFTLQEGLKKMIFHEFK
ncbi:MAG TPA: NAD-dependent epimerase/dehydratase family protein [Arcobacter sp.]|nr:NAD-dependent epimerase/dehydratase family protein [Arcobacter sp.]